MSETMGPDLTTPEFQSGLRELRAVMQDQTSSIHLDLTRWQAYCLIAQLQLALRHPGNTGMSRPVVEQIAHDLESVFSDSPILSRLLRMGWRERFE